MSAKIYCNNTFKEEAEKIGLRALFNLIPINFTWIDKEGRILGCNDNVLKCLEIRSFSEVFGKKANQVFLNEAWDNTKKVIDSGSTYVFDEIHEKNDGSKEYFLSIKSPMLSCTGEINGIVNIAIDITDRKLLEIELTKAKEALELSDKIKTEFLANMRHDLRTPLSGICNIVEMLEKHESDETKKEYLKDIKSCTDSVISQLNNILDHVKVESGELEIIETEFNLPMLLESIYKVLIPEATHKNLDLKIISDIKLPSRIMGDPVRTERILMNVISNALKFTNKGFVRVTLDWVSLPDNKGVAQFTIEDSGIGMPHDKLEHIFDRFTRLTEASQGIYPGTGLGLNIVKRFLSDIGGRYDVMSEEGKGSTFNICIPYNLPKPQVIKLKKNFMKMNKILLVEDHPVISKMSKIMLEDINELNCKVDVATSGKTAIALIDENTYDLILLDIGLPDIDGYKVAEHTRKRGIETPIVAITAHTEDEEARRCLESGMQQVIIKPLTEDIAKTFVLYL